MLSLSSRALRGPSVALALALAASSAPLPVLAQGKPEAAEALYGERMDKGLKLFQDKNYDAAIAEFYAAYKVNPRAAPLINIALSYKAQFKYAKAVAVLEEALEKHADTLDARDRQAAEAAIKELGGLLAHVTVKLSPPHARLTIDGEEVPSASLSKPVALSTGPHVLRASAEGHAPVEKKIEVVSGQEETVELKLVPTGGHVTIEADDPKTPIFVDNRQLGVGRWTGQLPAGPHIVEFRPSGAAPQVQRIDVAPGSETAVRPDAVKSLDVAPGTSKVAKPRRGLYLLGTASVFRMDRPPNAFRRRNMAGDFVGESDAEQAAAGAENHTGGAGGLRVGYRVNNPAAFELSLEYGSITASRELPGTSFQPKRDEPTGEKSEYSLTTVRTGANLRLMTSGRTLRLIGTVGGGIVWNQLTIRHSEGVLGELRRDVVTGDCESGGGCADISGFFQAEIGAELDLSNVLVDLVFASQVVSTAGLGSEAFSNTPLLMVGVGLRAGYAFW